MISVDETYLLKEGCLFLIAVLLGTGCDSKKDYAPGKPYYFRSVVANYQDNIPNGEISEGESKKYQKEGYACYKVIFNKDQLPISIEKHYKGRSVWRKELLYDGKQLINEIVTHEKGKGLE